MLICCKSIVISRMSAVICSHHPKAAHTLGLDQNHNSIGCVVLYQHLDPNNTILVGGFSHLFEKRLTVISFIVKDVKKRKPPG